MSNLDNSQVITVIKIDAVFLLHKWLSEVYLAVPQPRPNCLLEKYKCRKEFHEGESNYHKFYLSFNNHNMLKIVLFMTCKKWQSIAILAYVRIARNKDLVW